MYAIVFPGQGSQHVGMAGDFARDHPSAREVFETADRAFGGPLSSWILQGPESELRRTEITQPAVLAASIAIYRVLEAELPQPPALMAGHSLGEYTALVATRALDLADAVALVRQRGALMQEAVPEGEGAMLAVIGLEPEQVTRICAETSGVVAPANLNAPGQIVIAGAADAVVRAQAALTEAGARRLIPLEVSAPFHCPLMSPAQEKLAPLLAQTGFRDATIPIVSNVTAEPYRGGARARELLREQVCAPVRWTESVLRMRAEGVTLQLEVGPGRVLSGLAPRIDRGLARANLDALAGLEAAISAVREAIS